MTPAPPDPASFQTVAAELEALPEVRRAFVETDPPAVHLVCASGGGPPVVAAARAVLARAGFEVNDLALEVSYLRDPEPQRRVRFLGSTVEHSRTGHVRATVSLEWHDVEYVGTAEGEGGNPVEPRVAAQATLNGLEQLLEGRVDFRLVGIKSLQAFDAGLIVALVLPSDAPDRPLVGVSIAREAPHRSAALAVLNASNALLGNYLRTPA